MFKKGGFLFCLIILVFIYAGVVFGDDYLLGSGDWLDIGVYGYEELQVKNLMIRPDGKISFPLAGEVQAVGLTPFQLSANLTKTLAEYVKNPKVTINIVKFRTVRVYVLGEVGRPGLYEIEKQHNFLDAVSLAGGYTRYTAKRNVYIVQKATGKYTQINLDKLLTKGDLSQNYVLGDGDVVYFGRNGISFVNDILPIITGIYQIKEIVK